MLMGSALLLIMLPYAHDLCTSWGKPPTVALQRGRSGILAYAGVGPVGYRAQRRRAVRGRGIGLPWTTDVQLLFPH
jgi:hypothetical protein